ncbi:MAG TPA: ABC transporter permease [Bryobacteraceae bacterium]|nr:ABC transporter permease [Bryobacteraceae bacterium]
MHSLLEDLRYGLRILRASPGLTVTAIFTLALGIAANSTVFGWIDAVLLDPIPGASRGSELATLETVTPTGELENTAYRDYRDYRDSLRQVSGVAASLLNVFTVGDAQNPRLLWGEFVSANYFSVMGVQAVRGRTFLPEDGGDAPGGPLVVVISDRLWQSVFHRDPRAIGKTLRVNQRELTVVGVIPPAFHGTVPGLVLEMWIPASLGPEMNGQGAWLLDSRDARQMWLTARLRPGVTLGRARAEVVACAKRIAEAHPETNRAFSATLLPIWQGHLGAQHLLRRPLQVLMAVCLVLFLIVVANVANLQLARAATRQKEFGIRVALGAAPMRVVRQLFTESLILAIAGAAAGALGAAWCSQALVWLLPPTNLPIEFGLRPNWHLLAFISLICVSASVLTGIAPALHSVRASVMERLNENSRGSTSGPAAGRTRSLLVVSEVALGMVALVGTGVLARSFYAARAIDTGMDAHNVVCAKYYVETFCRTAEQRSQFSQRLAERLRGVPGVEGVSYSTFVPLEFGEGSANDVQVPGYVPAAGEDMRVINSDVSPGYFKVMRIPLLEGRDFREQDDRDTARVMIVNQAFQRRFFGNGPVIGRKVLAEGESFTVIGLVRDSKYYRLMEGSRPFYYAASRQVSGGEFWMAFFVRTSRPLGGVVPALRREAATVNPATRGSAFVPYQDWIGAAVYSERVAATLVGVLGAVCLFLSAIGLYSVLTFAVRQRTHEFGIRIALGGRPRHVLLKMLWHGTLLTVPGLAAGLLIALTALRLSSAFLPEVQINDPSVFAGAILVLGLVALLASYLPARRATKVDPMVALRHE